MPSTARTPPSPVRNSVCRSLTSSSGGNDQLSSPLTPGAFGFSFGVSYRPPLSLSTAARYRALGAAVNSEAVSARLIHFRESRQRFVLPNHNSSERKGALEQRRLDQPAANSLAR